MQDSSREELKEKLRIAIYIKNGGVFYAPFFYDGEDENTAQCAADNSIHFASGVPLEVLDGYVAAPSTEKEMHFVRLKNKGTGLEYLAIFTNIELLRQMFPNARVCVVSGAGFIQKFYKESAGIIIDVGAVFPNVELERYRIIKE